MSEPVSRRSDADIEKELVDLREIVRNQNNEIKSLDNEIESLECERQKWIKFAEADKAKIRQLEAALMANLGLLQTYMGRD